MNFKVTSTGHIYLINDYSNRDTDYMIITFFYTVFP